MRSGLVVVVLPLVMAGGCNQLFGLEPPVQADAGDDGDGGEIDSVASADDVDGDGVANAVDNCPQHANPAQADEDRDGDVNGGDACDPCPHLDAADPGTRHRDDDLDSVGDDCDPDQSIRHCWRWFDSFDDASPDKVLERYRVLGGTWKVDGGRLIQDEALLPVAEVNIAEPGFGGVHVATRGGLLTLPATGGDAGVTPTRNAVGVATGHDVGPGTCFAMISRDPPSPTLATVELARQTQLTEVVVASTVMGAATMTQGDPFVIVLDAFTTTEMPQASGTLPDDSRTPTTAAAATTCSAGDRAGVRTAWARAAFDHLIVIDLEGTAGCSPRGP